MARRQPLPNLTTVRFFAALYVFLFHFEPRLNVALGYTGVSLFFVLSGFILAYNYPEVLSTRRFYALRFARIYPLYAFALALALPHAISSEGHAHPVLLPLRVAAAFGMVQTWWPPFRNALVSPAWTLSVEMFFYAAFPFLLPWVSRHVQHWKRWIAVMVALLLLPSLVIFFVLIPRYPGAEQTLRGLLYLPIFRLGEFIIGMFAGLHFLHRRPVFQGRHVLAATLFVGAASLCAVHVGWTRSELIGNGLLALPYAVLLYTLAGWRSRWFGHPVLQLGGEISYGMYLLQFMVYTQMLRLSRHFHHDTPSSAVTLIVLLGVSFACYTLIEKNGRLLILRLLGFQASAKPLPTPGLST